MSDYKRFTDGKKPTISEIEAAETYWKLAELEDKIDASGNRVSYEGKELEELTARVEGLRTKALETDDFYKLAAANTEDSTMLEVTGGKGDFPEEYEKTVLSLKTGEVSEVIKTTDYYYIFYCVREFEIDEGYESICQEENSDNLF